MKIIKAKESDIDIITSLYNQLWKDRDNNIIQLKKKLEYLIFNKESDLFIVNINWKNVATFVLNYRIDLWTIWKAIRITAMIVDKDYRNIWIGKKIMDWLDKYWKDNWYSIIEIFSLLERDKAHNFYKKNWYEMVEYWFVKSL